jgi:glyoxylase-like metal-dependent hydrolase (beta-lactamase superfamily II)/ferredoxin
VVPTATIRHPSIVARVDRRLAANAAGDFFVDDSCIDCGACRWIAPASFGDAGDTSRVFRQPSGDGEIAAALRALVSCPTGSIGRRGRGAEIRRHVTAAAASFPYPLGGGVYHCGFHSADSFGAASYLIVRDRGNVLVDSPRFSRPLVRGIEALGGVALMFLTHRDDVADHARLRDHFGCERIIHRADMSRDTRGVERPIDGLEPVAIAGDLLVIPTPGHTRGSACLLRGADLFSGDHLAYSRDLGHLYAFSGACWYDWATQVESMERLAGYRFERVWPGHGAPHAATAEEMAEQLRRCIAWMCAARP